MKELKNSKRYDFLLYQLVKRDFKIRYRGSFFGVLWSLINPLINMIVLGIVFSNIFNMVPNYRIYLLSGLLIFNFYSEASNMSLNSIVSSFGLITKVNFPKYIIPLSKVISSSINLIITILMFLIICIFVDIKLWWGIVFIPYMIIFLILFSSGMSLILSSLQVFFRDTQHLYTVFLTMWMYATPIMYPVDIISEQFINIFKINPLYVFIDFFRTIVLDSSIPSTESFLLCFVWGTITFIVGIVIFIKSQDKFIYYS